jgi:hypothetical protein
MANKSMPNDEETPFQRKTRLKAEADGISLEQAAEILEREAAEKVAGRNTGAPKSDEVKAQRAAKKAEKEDLLIDSFISHLNLIINWKTYNEYWEAAQVAKMAQIKSHCETSKHSRIPEVRILLGNVIEIVRNTYNEIDVER